MRDELQRFKADAADKSCTIQDLEDKLKHRDELYDKARLTIQKLMLSIKNQQIENSRLKNNTQSSNVSSNEKEVRMFSILLEFAIFSTFYSIFSIQQEAEEEKEPVLVAWNAPAYVAPSVTRRL